MAVGVQASGTQLAVINTEHSLVTLTGAGVYVFVVDLAAMLADDALELRWKTKVLNGGTTRTIDMASYSDAQPTDSLVFQSVPIPLDATAAYLEFTLKQVRGTGRNYPFKILNL